MGLKKLLKRVVHDLTRGQSRRGARSEEPIPTRTMAELLIQQGHLERAEAILRGLRGSDAAARLREVIAMRARAQLSRALQGSPPRGVTVGRHEGLCAIAWAIESEALGGAQRLLPDGELVLRVTEVAAGRDDRVEISVTDQPIPSEGAEILEADIRAHVIVSVGLRSGDTFVSVAHATG